MRSNAQNESLVDQTRSVLLLSVALSDPTALISTTELLVCAPDTFPPRVLDQLCAPLFWALLVKVMGPGPELGEGRDGGERSLGYGTYSDKEEVSLQWHQMRCAEWMG